MAKNKKPQTYTFAILALGIHWKQEKQWPTINRLNRRWAFRIESPFSKQKHTMEQKVRKPFRLDWNNSNSKLEWIENWQKIHVPRSTGEHLTWYHFITPGHSIRSFFFHLWSNDQWPSDLCSLFDLGDTIKPPQTSRTVKQFKNCWQKKKVKRSRKIDWKRK